jgi:simple sugar transport system substrate-binding protein/basic membrane protein A
VARTTARKEYKVKRHVAAFLKATLLVFTLGFAGAQAESFDVALFFPGDLGGNPIEPPITAGVNRVREAFPNVTVRVVEGGAASDWETGATALAASGKYELIITFTDGMPQIIESISKLFPNQKWAMLDSSAPGQPNVYSIVYSDEALGFLGGAVAGLLATNEAMSRDLASPSVGLLAGTPYPQMDNSIHPGFAAGAKYGAGDVEVLYAVVGSWNDPNRARDLALNMFNRGATVVMSVTGGGDSGVYRAAKETGGYAVGVNTNQNGDQPGVILASVLKRLDNSIYSVVERAMAGELPYGTVDTAGVKEGAISLADDDYYRLYVPASVRERLSEIQAGMASGEVDYLELTKQALGQ